ncbi:hypothetical protein THRCLA_02464, partial [Thraustotheca clavata]
QYKTPNEARDIAQTYNQKSFGGKPIDVQWAGGIVESTIPTNIEPLPPVRKLCNANQIREYVDQKVDIGGELESKVIALLNRLMQIQERARLTNPLKAKKTRRIVFGLREVKRGLKNLKIMCLLVAYDVDECTTEGGLDDKVVELIDLARTSKIPVVFSLSKRKLGKAVLKTIRVSCVGIYNVDGANEMWSDVKSVVQALQNNPSA